MEAKRSVRARRQNVNKAARFQRNGRAPCRRYLTLRLRPQRDLAVSGVEVKEAARGQPPKIERLEEVVVICGGPVVPDEINIC